MTSREDLLPAVSRWGVIAAAAYGPLTFVASEWSKRPSLTVALTWTVAYALLALAVVRWTPARPAVVAVFFVVWAFWPTIRLRLGELFGPGEELLLALPIFGAAVVVGRMLARRSQAATVFLSIVIALAVANLGLLVSGMLAGVGSFDAPNVELSTANGSPDIVLLVVDGYAGSAVFEDMYASSDAEFRAALEARDVRVVPGSATNYSMTYTAMTATLNMSYPIGEGVVLGPAERVALYAVLSGDNAVVEALRRAGYRYTHVESGWGGMRCGPAVDDCRSAGIFEETSMALVRATPFAGVFESSFGHVFSHGASHSFDRLRDALDDRSDQPDFIMAHVVLPHAPLHVTADCSVEPAAHLRGLNVGAPWFGSTHLEVRRAAYLQQAQCAQRQVLETLDAIDDDTVFVIMSDHGPDGNGQLLFRTADWSQADVTERLSTLLAVRGADGCVTNNQQGGVNLFRTLFGCIFGSELPPLEQRHYIVNVEQNHPDDASRLVAPP